MPQTLSTWCFFTGKLKWFLYQKLSYILAGHCFWTLRASEDSGLNLGKWSQFSTATQTKVSLRAATGERLFLPVCCYYCSSLLNYCHVFHMTTPCGSRSRCNPTVAHKSQKSHTPHLPGPGQQSKLWLWAFVHSFLDRTLSHNTCQPQPCKSIVL